MDKDTFSKSDPFCVVFQYTHPNEYKEIGRTEVIMNNLNPQWARKIYLDYYFEERQRLKFEMWVRKINIPILKV
jgi:hypothetical protein